jgi:hypothetical protein
MKVEPFRELTKRERGLLDRLLEPSFPGREQVTRQLETALTRPYDEHGCLEFQVISPAPIDQVKYPVPTEGEYEDVDGMTVHVLLHIHGNQVGTLDIWREDGQPVKAWPDPGKVRVFAPE